MFFGKLLTIVRDELAKTPSKKSGDMSYKELCNEISALLGWACPEIETDRLKKIIPCRKCVHYKKFKKRSESKRAMLLCSIDMSKKDPDFYCKDGEEIK